MAVKHRLQGQTAGTGKTSGGPSVALRGGRSLHASPSPRMVLMKSPAPIAEELCITMHAGSFGAVESVYCALSLVYYVGALPTPEGPALSVLAQ